MAIMAILTTGDRGMVMVIMVIIMMIIISMICVMEETMPSM